MLRPVSSVLVTVLALAAMLLPTAAHAERWAAPDGRGDVTGWHYDPEPAPCGTDTDVDGSTEANDDITMLRVRHTRTQVRLRARLRDLDPARDQGLTFHVATPRGDWAVALDYWQTRAGELRVMVSLSSEPEEPDVEDGGDCVGVGIVEMRVPCRIGRAVDPDLDVVSATVPRSCLRNPRWVRVGLDSYGVRDSEDPEDHSFTVFSDAWGVTGEWDAWLPPYGPRVLAPTKATRGGPVAGSRLRTGEVRAVPLAGGGYRLVR